MTTRAAKTTQKLVIFGAASFGEEVADIAEESGAFEVVAFVEGLSREKCGQPLCGRPVLWIDDAAPFAQTCRAVCAAGSTKRGGFIRQAQALGFQFATVVHPSAHISPSATLGAGTIVSPGAIIAAHTQIGRHVIVNRGCLVGHHVRIGDGVTLSPGANIAGCTHIGEAVYVGMGAIVLERRTIGSGAVVGAGAVVTRDVPAQTQVLGIPAREVKKLP